MFISLSVINSNLINEKKVFFYKNFVNKETTTKDKEII